MDDERLAKILSDDSVPEIDQNARKHAANLAVTEFKKQKQKKSQGVSILDRLIGIGKTNKGVGTMEQKRKKQFMYGGMATAMAVILVGSLSFTQLNDAVRRNAEVAIPAGSDIKSSPDVGAVELNGAKFKTDDNVGDKDAVQQWRREQAQVAEGKISPAYTESVEQQNEADLERAITEGSSSIPVPVKTFDKRSDVAEAEEQSADSLQNWRRSGEGNVGAENAPTAAVQAAPSRSLSKKGQVMGRAPAKMKAQGFADEVRSHNRPESMIMPHPDPMPPVYQDQNRDKFDQVAINAFKSVTAEPVSTFSSDVDTASYSFVRKQLNNGRKPNPNAVRIEEMINYFDYNYPVPENRAEPFAPSVTVLDSPWAEGKKVMHIGIKGYELQKAELRSNIVFLLDVSGSMNAQDKLPLVKNSMKMLLDSLHPDDTVSIVVYAGHTGVVLEPTPVSRRSTILNAMNNLRAGGGTAGAAGIQLAYDMAEQNFDQGAVNRIILATDGDFNVGISNHEELKDFVANKRDRGIFLSVLGFGQGNYNDQMMQALAQNGNGIAAYIDNLNEARKVLVQEATSSLFPIAKDVKFQVEFNPALVSEYRLIGYETRALKREDFNNDKIDAGDMGAGHTVTAIYEFVPVGSHAVSVDPLRYTAKAEAEDVVVPDNGEYAFLKIRYKLPLENTSKLITRPVTRGDEPGYCPEDADCLAVEPTPSGDTAFALSVAAFGQILKGGHYTGNFGYNDVIELASQGRGDDPYGYRAEFINLVRLAQTHSR